MEINPKILRIAAEICAEYGSIMGDRTCQDTTDDIASAADDLSAEELDRLHRQYEQYNSDGDDYVPGEFAKRDGLTLGLAIGRHLTELADTIEHGG